MSKQDYHRSSPVTLTDGTITSSLLATDLAGNTSAAALAEAMDAISPGAPFIAGDVLESTNQKVLTSAALFDGTTQLGTATANAGGGWSFVTDTLANGASFTAPALDWSGNSGPAAAPFIVTGDSAGQSPFTVGAVPPVTVANGATVEIDGVSAQTVTFAGTTGTLKLDDAVGFTGQVSGLTGSDALDLADVSNGANTTATFSGNAKGGTLTVTNGAETANIALVGDYLDSGWTLSSDGHGGTVVVDPPLAGSVYPNATNTGVPAGVTLTPSGGLTITAPGVYSDLDISGGVYIDASNVTLENCIITMPSSGNFVIGVAGGLTGVTIENCEIFGPALSGQEGTYGIYVEGDSQVTINADNIHDVGTGVVVSDGQIVVENSYIHDLNAGSGTHYNGVMYNGGGSANFSLLIQNNTIINQNTQTDAVMIDNYFGAVNNVTVKNNLLYGGDYPIYVDGSQGSDPITNVSITNNDLGLGTGSFGYTDFNQTSPVYTGNVDDGATLVAALPSAASSAVDVTVPSSSPPPSGSNLVANGNFATGNFTDWTLGANDSSIQIDTDAEGDSTYAVHMGSVGSDGTLSQTIATTAGQTYTLSFWLQNEGAGPNDFSAIWNGQTLLSSTNAAASGYTEYTYTVTATGSSSVLEFSAMQDPSNWDLDNISLTANGTSSGPTLSSIVESPASGDLDAGNTVTLTLNLSEAVTVAGGTPTLTLNDGGTATYSGGSGTDALTFSYTVAAGQNTSALTASAINLNAATITDGAGNAANLSLTGLTQTGPQVDTTTPVISSIAESPSSGDLNAGKVVTITLDMSEVVTVNTTGGSPTLTLNDGGTATYVGGSGTNALTFSYAVLAGQNTPDLMETAVNLNGATIEDGASNAANLSLAGLPQGSPQIDTTTPTVASVTESPSSGDLGAGKTVTLTLTLSEAVTVAGGTPTLTLNDGGTATYTSGSGTNALTFSYTVGAGQSTSALAATAVNFNSATITDGAGNAANVSLTGLIQTGPQIPPAAPVISTGVANSKESVTLTGTAPDGSTVTVSDGGATALGSATASSTGAWSFTTADLAAGTYAFTATDTTSAGTSAASSPFDVTVTSSSPPPSASNLVANGNFATGNFTDWTLGGNDSSIQIDTDTEGDSTYAVHMGSVGSDGTLSQTIATVAGQTYTLSFWLQNEGAGPNDFSAIWNGQTLLSLTNAAASGYTEYTYTVTATGSSSVLEFSAMQDPSHWDLDNISLTANGTSSTTPPPAAPVISTGVENSNESVTLTGTASDGSTVTVSDSGGATALGTTTASSTGAWSFTTANLAAGSYAFTATDTTSAGTSAASSAFDVMVPPPPPAAPVISTGVANSNESVTLTGTAPDGSTVTVSDGSATALGTTTASSNGAWSFTTADFTIPGYYAFTATDTTSAGTSAASSAFDVTVPDPPSTTTPVTVYDSVLSTGQTLGAESNKSFAVTGSDTSVTFGAGTNNTVTLQGSGDSVTFGVDSDNTVTLLGSEESVSFGSGSDSNNVTLQGSGDSVTFGAGSSSNMVTLQGSGDSVELAAADSASITFSSSTGTLILDEPSTFSGEIFNFTGNGSLSGSDQIDLKGINYNSVHDSYANGVLTVTDGTDTVKLDFNGSYTLANFAFASDGNGGTIVYDPPTSNALASTSSGQTSGGQGRNFTGTVSGFEAQDVFNLPSIAFDAPTTLGYLPGSNQTGGTLPFMDGAQSAKIALLGNYMASSFAAVGDNHGGTMVTEAWQASDQSLLTHPQHT